MCWAESSSIRIWPKKLILLLLIFMQFWSESHLNKLDRLTPQDVWNLLTKFKTLQLQEFSSAVVCAELRAAQCVFDRRSSSYCLMLDPSSVCSCSDYWMCEWSVHGPGKIPKTDRKKGKLPSQLFSRSFFLFFFFGKRVENQLLFWQARFIFNAVISYL